MKKKDDSYEKFFYEKDLNIGQLRTFLEEFALSEKVDRPDSPRSQETSQEKQSEQPKPKEPHIKVTHLNVESFDSEINKHERVVLVHLFNEENSPILPQITEKYR